MNRKHFLTCTLALLIAVQAFSQDDKNSAVTFEELYDEPYAINKLFIGFQPLYADVFATNLNAGFGMEAQYYYRDKFDIKAHFRKSYSAVFYDFNRDLALKNSNVDNKPEIYNYFEIGGTWHFKDFETASKTKMTLFKNSYKGNKWAGRVPLLTEVPSKLRRIYGGRLGAVVWNGTAGLNKILEDQGKSNADLVNENGEGLPQTYLVNNKQEVFNVYGNVFATAIYAGASLTRIRNVAVTFDNYEGGIDDGILNLYFDIMYAPALRVDNILYNGSSYSTSALKMSPLGARLGLDVKYNRSLSWGYGAEVGYRPSIQGRSFFAMFKVAFPIFSSNLENKVESFGK